MMQEMLEKMMGGLSFDEYSKKYKLTDHGYLYFVRELREDSTPKKNQRFKIGTSKENLPTLKKMETNNSRKMEIYANLYSDDLGKAKKDAHIFFKDHRIRNEWFAISQADVDTYIKNLRAQ